MLYFVTGYAQIIEYRSAGNGLWNEATSWQMRVDDNWINSPNFPNSTVANKVIIRKGHQINIKGIASCSNLNLEPGATLEGASTSTLQIGTGVNPYNLEVSIENNGTIGSTNPAEGFLNIVVAQNTSEVWLTGIGLYKIGSLKAIGGNPYPLNVIINQHLTISALPQELAFSAYGSGSKNTDRYTFTINTDKTVVINSGFFNALNGDIIGQEAGIYTYHIKGTLDLSNSLLTHFVPLASSQSAVMVNVSGLFKTGKKFNAINEGTTKGAGKLVFLIDYGGVVDASRTEEFSMGNTFFMTHGNGILKRTVGNTDTTFPIGACFINSFSCTPSALNTVKGTYNPVVLNNPNGELVFSANVNNKFENPVPDSTIVVKREWSVVADATANNVQVKLGWSADDQASRFKPDSVSMIRYDGTAWNENTALLSPTDTDDITYLKSFFNDFGKFSVQNTLTSSQNLLQFTAELSAGPKKEVNLNWKYNDEHIVAHFNIERSVDQKNYDSIGVVNSLMDNGVHTYVFADVNPKYGVSYYRLKLIRTDQTFEYSENRTIKNNLEIPLTLYPNPVNNQLTVDHITAQSGAFIKIISAEGKVVFNQTVNDENNTRSFNVAYLTPGFYILVFRNANRDYALKFLKE